MTALAQEARSERWRAAAVWSMTAFAGTLPFSHVPAQLALAIGIVAWIGWSFSSKTPMVIKDRFFVAAGIYWFWNVLAAVLSIRPMHTLAAFVDNEWPACAGLLLFWSVRSTDELRRIAVFFFGASGIAMSYGIVQTFTGIEWIKGTALDEATGGLFRAVGFSGFPLTFAGFAMAVFFLSVAFALERPSARIRWILPALSAIAILGTFARSVWLAMAILVPLFAWLAGTPLWRKRALAAGIVLVMVVAGFEPLRERALSVFDLGRNQIRIKLWKTSLAIARDHPLIGIGQDNFTVVFDEYKVGGFYDTHDHPHNDYLSVLVHGGVPALIAFVAMWWIVLRRAWEVWKRNPGGTLESWLSLGGGAALGGFLLSAMFQNYYGTFVNCFNWWMITGIVLSSYHRLLHSSSSRM